MSILQIVVVIFVLFALTRTVKKFRDGGLALVWFLVWLCVWGAIGVVVVLPQTSQMFARLIGVGRGVDAAVYVAIIGLFYVVFRIFLRLERIEHDISSLVRHLSLRDGGVDSRVSAHEPHDKSPQQ